jgi:hypothetical protein
VRPCLSLIVVVLMVFSPAFAGDERGPTGPVDGRAADLGLGAVDAQVHALGGGVGEHVGQGA